MLFILCVGLTIKVKVGIPESFKVGWYPPKKTGSSHLKTGWFHGLKKEAAKGKLGILEVEPNSLKLRNTEKG